MKAMVSTCCVMKSIKGRDNLGDVTSQKKFPPIESFSAGGLTTFVSMHHHSKFLGKAICQECQIPFLNAPGPVERAFLMFNIA